MPPVGFLSRLVGRGGRAARAGADDAARAASRFRRTGGAADNVRPPPRSPPRAPPTRGLPPGVAKAAGYTAVAGGATAIGVAGYQFAVKPFMQQRQEARITEQGTTEWINECTYIERRPGHEPVQYTIPGCTPSGVDPDAYNPDPQQPGVLCEVFGINCPPPAEYGPQADPAVGARDPTFADGLVRVGKVLLIGTLIAGGAYLGYRWYQSRKKVKKAPGSPVANPTDLEASTDKSKSQPT